MSAPDALLFAALRAAPRRYGLPPLPADVPAARARGPEVALAFALEAVRAGQAGGPAPPPAVRTLFLEALAELLRAALAPAGGDPALQALVLRAGTPEVQAWVRLAAGANADRRAVRAVVDAAAHPGKLRALPPDAARASLQALHARALAGEWSGLREAAERLPDPVRDRYAALATLADAPALQRLVALAGLERQSPVRRYRALLAGHGPAAGSDAAASRGRASAEAGAAAEQATVEALRAIAAALEARAPRGWRVVRSLTLPRGFPGAADKAKEEWDAALVRDGGAGAHIVLLVEVKASPAAATPDAARLLRGLQRLAQADAAAVHAVPSADGVLSVAGASLRALRPAGFALPQAVLYVCAAPPEARPQLLAAASRAVLLAEPACVAWALRLAQGEAPPVEALAPVWDALPREGRLRSALHQYETAQAVRAAMLHPDDLRAVAVALGDA